MMETSPLNSAPNLSTEMAKLFVGRINESLNEEEMGNYFAKFGEVKDVVVVKDKVTGSVRGFGFVEFLHPDSAERALNEKEHAIGDQTVEVKRARPRGERWNHQSPQYQYTIHSDQESRGLTSNVTNNDWNNENPAKLKKIFVGGLPPSITDDEFRSYFEQFGNITDVVIMYDSTTQRPRGFGFITFDSVEAVEYALQKQFHELNNKTVEVKLAVPKDSNYQNNFVDSNGSMGGGGPPPANHQGGYYPPYSPTYVYYPGYAPQHVLGYYHGTAGYVGGYGVGPYGGVGYGTSFVNPRSPMASTRRSPVPYGNAFMYSGYGFGGYTGMANTGGYHAYICSGNDKLNQTDARIEVHTAEPEDTNEKLEIQQTH